MKNENFEILKQTTDNRQPTKTDHRMGGSPLGRKSKMVGLHKFRKNEGWGEIVFRAMLPREGEKFGYWFTKDTIKNRLIELEGVRKEELIFNLSIVLKMFVRLGVAERAKKPRSKGPEKIDISWGGFMLPNQGYVYRLTGRPYKPRGADVQARRSSWYAQVKRAFPAYPKWFYEMMEYDDI